MGIKTGKQQRKHNDLDNRVYQNLMASMRRTFPACTAWRVGSVSGPQIPPTPPAEEEQSPNPLYYKGIPSKGFLFISLNT